MGGRLQDRIAIVTGAGCIGPGWGNGRATAVRFAEEGAKVFAVDRDLDSVTETVERVKAAGGEIVTHQCDVTDGASVEVMVEGLRRALRPHRHPGEQCRRLGRRRAGRDERGSLGRAGRSQPEKRVPDAASTCCR